MGSELSSKTLGVVGMGRVGSQTATFARSLGMNVLAYDPYISAEVLSKRGVSPVDFDELLAKSDYITLHIPKTAETGNLIGPEEIARMRDGVRIINCARGGLIDEEALVSALDSGKVGGLAVDVYQQEPPDPDDPLIGRDDVVCTPHLGASTAEAQENVATSVAKQVVAYLTEGVVGHAVNLPSLSPEMLEQIGPHLDLADRLGDFLAQLAGGGLQTLEVVYGGAIDMPMKALAASAIKGMLGRFLSSVRVNMVNGLLLAKERGIEVRATSRSENLLYTDLIELRVKTDSGERSVAGTFLRKNDPRIVRIDDYSVDVALRGYLLIFRNEDRPGLIGKMGTLLGNNNINIAGMQLGRVWQQDMAVAVLILDDPVPEPVMEEVRAIPHVYDACLVRLVFHETDSFPAGHSGWLARFLPGEARRKREVEESLLSVFEQWGFRELLTPAFEFYVPRAGSEVLDAQTYRMVDLESGGLLALRADMTPQIARAAGTILAAHPRPLRLSYATNVFRHAHVAGELQREFWQAGVELIGLVSLEADAEMIAIAVECLQANGVNNFRMSLSHGAFLRGILGALGLEGAQRAELLEAIARRDSSGVASLLKGVPRQKTDAGLLERIPECFGGIEVLLGVEEKIRTPAARGAVRELLKVSGYWSCMASLSASSSICVISRISTTIRG